MAVQIDIEQIQAVTRRIVEALEIDVRRRVPLRPLTRAVAHEVGCSATAALPYVAQVVRVLRAQAATQRKQRYLDLALVFDLLLAKMHAERGEDVCMQQHVDTDEWR